MRARLLEFQRLLEGASDRRGLIPLIEGLGFVPVMSSVPRIAWRAYGLTNEVLLDDLVIAGERAGLVVLLLELRSLDSPAVGASLARRIRTHNPIRPLFFILTDPRYERIGFGSFGVAGEFRQLLVEREAPLRSDLEVLSELSAREGEGGVELLHRHAQALDRSRLTRQFFHDFRALRDEIAASWHGMGASGEEYGEERDQLALLLLSRLLFLYFLQRAGHLEGDRYYLPRLYQGWVEGALESDDRGRDESFYRAVLRPLFFGALNTRPGERGAAARRLGELPYLNGGLFDYHPLERDFPDLDLDDDLIGRVFDGLLERYRFTTREAVESVADESDEVGVDPEMLGQVFEELMAADRREASGTFFTPAAVVNRLVTRALDLWLHRLDDALAEIEPSLRRRHRAEALARIRVLDPACGSGAFLLGALSRLTRVRAELEGGEVGSYRRTVVADSLYGLDLQGDAALLCALRLWLALTLGAEEGELEPLPNLDRKIRQGDALIDPLDLGGAGVPGTQLFAGELREALRRVAELTDSYLSAGPGQRERLQRILEAAERELAGVWLEVGGGVLEKEIDELRLEALSPDLFGELPPDRPALDTRRRLLEDRLAELEGLQESLAESGALPFFSFDIHFADPEGRGFDLILSNPPWVRAHRWPASLGSELRRRYSVAASPGWARASTLTGAPRGAGAQVDLSLLFLERSIFLLDPGGVLAILLPAKVLRSLYGGGARRLLLRETRLAHLEDHSLDQRSIFRADAYTTALITERRRTEDTGEGGVVEVEMIRRGAPSLSFQLSAEELPIIPGDFEAPWLIVPPGPRRVIRKMQAAGPPLGSVPGLRVRRGIETGANEVFIVEEVEPKLGGLAWIRTSGYERRRRGGERLEEAERFEALVEDSGLRPLVRGSGIRAWCYDAQDHLVWCHDDMTAEPIAPPPRLAAYLDRHDERLRQRSGWRPGLPIGTVFHLSSDTLGPKVAWRDLAPDLEAVAIPKRVRSPIGRDLPVVPLNTIYFVPVDSYDEALILAAFFNSLPVRTLARSIAERAKDASFRFFAWTIALIPLPPRWDTGLTALELLELSRAAHRVGGLDSKGRAHLDRLVGSLYGLDEEDLRELRGFDQWLRGS